MEKKKTVLVTGASGAIGAAIAEAFLKDGHRVILQGHRNYEKAAHMAALAKAQGLSALALRCDLTSEADIVRMTDEARAYFGTIEVLVNNAGVALPQKLLTDCTAEEWDALFAVDVRAVFLTCKAVLPDMIAKKCGSIVNVSSIWGLAGGSCEAPYSAAKAAVIGLTKALAREAGPSNVRVNCVAPGFVETPMNAHLSREAIGSFCDETPLTRTGKPNEIASAAKFLALSDADFITGQVLAVDGGYTA